MKTLRFAAVALILLALACWWLSRPQNTTAPLVDPQAQTPLPVAGDRVEQTTATPLSASPKAPGFTPQSSAPPDGASPVTPALIERFVASRGRTAGSLLAAWTESGDLAWLREAATRFPGEPAVLRAVLAANLFPEQRAEWLQRFRDAAPGNPLPDYFAARDAAVAGDRTGFLAALRASTGKQSFDDYLLSEVADREALHALFTDSPTKALDDAYSGLPLDYVQSLRETTKNLLADQKAALASGDTVAAFEAAALGVDLGRAMADPASHPMLIRELIGLATEQSAIEALMATPGAGASLGFDLGDRLTELQQRRQELRLLDDGVGPIQGATPAEITEFYRRFNSDGEIPARQWLAGIKIARQP